MAETENKITMTRIIQNSDGRGSLKDIQVLVNKNQNIINNLLKSSFKELAAAKVSLLNAQRFMPAYRNIEN